jgi:uncharacterized protein (TIGR03435 family)
MFWKKLLLMAAGVAALLSTPRSQAQSPSANVPPISYVASVKPNNTADARGFSEYLPGGRLTAKAITVRDLLRNAYRIQPYQLVGAPDWISTRRYDIEAKVEDTPPPSLQALYRVLLRDRFKLAIRNETRELPVFALVLARNDGKLGPQLVKSTFDCAAYLAGPHALPEPGSTPNCSTRINTGFLSGKAISMSQLATSLAPFVSRFTNDKTGLTGIFDVELTWTPEQNSLADATSDTSRPSIFTTLQEQLGLKLISEKGPVDVMVIDHLEEPSEN